MGYQVIPSILKRAVKQQEDQLLRVHSVLPACTLMMGLVFCVWCAQGIFSSEYFQEQQPVCDDV